MTPPTTPSPRPGCPEFETLAAFAEGRLAGEERATLIAHLADCDACREILVEAAELARSERTHRGVLRFPGRASPRIRQWALAAAMLGLVVVGAAVVRRLTTPTVGSTLVHLAQAPGLAERLGADWSEPAWSVTRGAGPLVSDRARAFRLGARSADLELALRMGDPREAHRLAIESETLLRAVALAEPIASVYHRLALALPHEPLGSTPQGLLGEALTASQLTRQAVDPPLYDLGRWGETVRLARLSTRGSTAPAAYPRRPDLPADLPPALRDLDLDLAHDPALDEALTAFLAAGGDLR